MEEKIEILKNYTLRKILDKYEFSNQITISDAACKLLSKEGLRDIEKKLQDVIARINVVSKIPNKESRAQILIKSNIEDFNGFPYEIKENLFKEKSSMEHLSKYSNMYN
jgi:ATP-dependent Lon protease